MAATREAGGDAGAERVELVREAAAEDDDLGAVEVEEVGEAGADEVGLLGHERAGGRVAGGRGGEDGGRVIGRPRRCAGARGEGGAGGIGLPAAAVAAGTGRAVADDGHVADVPARPMRPRSTRPSTTTPPPMPVLSVT